MRVVPKAEIGIPNFIVIGNAKVQGKVVYSKKANISVIQCVNCFSEQHLKNSPSCSGIRDWSEYCEEYERKKEEAKGISSVFEEGRRTGGEDRLDRSEEEVAELMAQVAEKKEENVKLAKTVKELEEKIGSDRESLLELTRKMEEVSKSKSDEIVEKEEEILRLKKAEENIKEKMEQLERTKDEDEETKKVQESLKDQTMWVKEKEKLVETLKEEREQEKREMKRLMDANTLLTEELKVFKEKEKERQTEAEIREHILASSLERSKEFDNLMEGVSNLIQETPEVIEDDPHLSEENLNRTIIEDSQSENDDETTLGEQGGEGELREMDSGQTKKKPGKNQKRHRESPSNGEPQKKVNVDKIGIKIQYDGEGNFVSIPFGKKNGDDEEKEDSEYGTPIAKVKGMDDNATEVEMGNEIGTEETENGAEDVDGETEAMENGEAETSSPTAPPDPPPVPPRPSSRNSIGPPVSRLSKSPCDELDLLFPRLRRDSTRGVVGFDFGAGMWEVNVEGAGNSSQTKSN